MKLDVRIRRLELKVTQRGAPWLAREELARVGERSRRAVLASLERILERSLGGGGSGDERLGTIDVALVVDGKALDADPARALLAFEARLEARLAQARASKVPIPLPGTDEAPPESAGVDEAAPDLEALAQAPAALLRLLLEWHVEQRLVAILSLIGEQVAQRWLETIGSTIAGRSPAPESRLSAVAAMAGRGSPDSLEPLEGAALELAPIPTRSGRTLALLVALAADFAPFRPPTSLLAALLPEPEASWVPAPSLKPVLELAGRGPSVASLGAENPQSAVLTPISKARPSTALPLPTIERVSDARGLPRRASLQTALPFLLLSPLERIGWLPAAAAIVDGPNNVQHAHALGYALALKALPIPERGWRHRPEHVLAAAYAAGLAEPPRGMALLELERGLGEQCSALDAVIADSLIRGHEPRSPLLLVEVPMGMALVEPQGSFVLSLASCWSELAPIAVAAGAPLWIDAALVTAVAADIDRTGLWFVADAVSARGESWPAIAGPRGWRGMTNAPSEARPALIRAIEGFKSLPDQVRDSIDALGPKRPLAAAMSFPAIDRVVSLATSTALGEICWRLFGIDPLAWAEPDARLALERFGDLSATMSVSRDEIEIKLPIGPRSRDLARAGLLANIECVPWLGRKLRFGIG